MKNADITDVWYHLFSLLTWTCSKQLSTLLNTEHLKADFSPKSSPKSFWTSYFVNKQRERHREKFVLIKHLEPLGLEIDASSINLLVVDQASVFGCVVEGFLPVKGRDLAPSVFHFGLPAPAHPQHSALWTPSEALPGMWYGLPWAVAPFCMAQCLAQWD